MVLKRKFMFVFLAILFLMSSLTIVSGAEGYVSVPEVDTFEEEGYPVPMYDIIHSIELYATEEKVTAALEADDAYSLRITLTLYEQKGSGWSFLAKKTFSDHSRILVGSINYNFQPGVTYKAVANYNAGGETDSMEDIFSF